MGQDSKIEWTDHTFNPWMGCTKVSAGCKHCYAEGQMDHRWNKLQWGPGKPRVRTSEAMWRKPLAWHAGAEFFVACGACGMRSQRRFGGPYKGLSPCPNEECKSDGQCERVRPRVFCASLADLLDSEAPSEWLIDLLALIEQTPDLDWLLLTKRPQLWRRSIQGVRDTLMARSDIPYWWGSGLSLVSNWLEGRAPENVWIGTSVEDQETAEARIPHLLNIPAAVRFLSCEPLLGSLDLASGAGVTYWDDPCAGIHWVICGGESGPQARPMHPDWARGLRDQCNEAGVSFFFKQWGQHDSEMRPVGKKVAGRLLDGREWNEVPRA